MSDFWTLITQLAVIEAIPGDELTDADIEQVGEIACTILATPAPSPEALLWKLQYLLAADHAGATAPWDGDMVAQTMLDSERILGGAQS